MKNFNVKPILIFVVSITIIVNAVLIILKHSDAEEEEIVKEKTEVIYVVNEENNIKVDNIHVEKEESSDYLVFDVVRLSSDLNNTSFDIKLLYDGDEVFKNSVVIESFDGDSVSKKLELPKMKYKFELLSVDLEFDNNSNDVEN